jgi:NTP pyrophosphatase (non-canonical NTP hydrolase)
MKLENEFQPIRDWAEEKGIYKKGDLKTQVLKLQEESGELCKAVLNNDEFEIIDAIGDCVVVLTSIAELADKHFKGGAVAPITIEYAINSAYTVINKRKGKMINGTFVKDEK